MEHLGQCQLSALCDEHPRERDRIAATLMFVHPDEHVAEHFDSS
jgi:hypothetical protein